MIYIKEIELLEKILKLGPTEFIGLATYLKIPLTISSDSKEPRDAMDLICDILEEFKHLNRFNRRKLIKLINAAGDKNGA